jgi:hypothetical protein
VGKGAGTIINTNGRLSFALPTKERATRVDVDGGQRRTIGFALLKSIATAFAHPTALDSRHD